MKPRHCKRDGGQNGELAQPIETNGVPYGIQTRVAAVKGRRELSDINNLGAEGCSEQHRYFAALRQETTVKWYDCTSMIGVQTLSAD